MQPSHGIAAVASVLTLALLPAAMPRPAAAQAPTPRASATPAASADNMAGIPSTVSTATRPDVQIVISPVMGQWVVAAVYPSVTDREKALGRAKSLLSIAGWKGSDLTFENSAAQSGLTASGQAASPAMSSVSFSTIANAVDWASGTADLEPIIRAYKDLSHLQVLYMVPAGFKFHGIRQYSDANVDIALSGGQGALLYVVQVKNHDLGALNLPRIQESPQPGQGAARVSSGTRRGGNAVLVVIIALLAAAAAFFGVRRWSQTSGV